MLECILLLARGGNGKELVFGARNDWIDESREEGRWKRTRNEC